jgi:hypothetical protein
MNDRQGGFVRPSVIFFVLALLSPGWADPPAGPNLWLARDIGSPAIRGSTSVDANGVWTLRGSGDDIWGTADNFQFAYQTVKGDVTLIARYLSLEGGDPDWAKVGLMIRENDTPGSPNVHFHMAHAHGLAATPRLAQNEISGTYLEVGPSTRREPNTLMRLQRAGNQISGLYSRDGILWSEAFGPVPLPTLPAEALVGLAVTSHHDGAITTGQLDQVSLQSGALAVTGLRACVGDRSVLLQWRAVKSAVAYNIYRGPAGAAPGQLVKRNSVALSGVSFADSGDGLESGTPVTYAVAGVFASADGASFEGPPTVIPATPQAIPSGLMGCSIYEGLVPGGAAFDAATGKITLLGGGVDLVSDNGDQCYFLNQPVEGDFQVTVKALGLPSPASDSARAGIMIRDSLDAGARHAFLAVTRAEGVTFEWRSQTDAMSQWPGTATLSRTALRFPLLLRLTRRGDTIVRSYSLDGGTTFRLSGPGLVFTPGLPQTLFVGLAITAADRRRTTQADFADLAIQRP